MRLRVGGEQRQFFTAGHAPGGPEGQNHYLAPQIGRGDATPIECDEHGGRRGLAEAQIIGARRAMISDPLSASSANAARGISRGIHCVPPFGERTSNRAAVEEPPAK